MLAPESARAAIREMFLAHVIGGKHLSKRADFARLVRGATPDVVLTAVELLARGLDAEHPGAGDVVVVDVGGATTDVHSVVEPDPEAESTGAGGLSREVVATTPVTRTVEGDLGMRWSATSTVTEAGLGDLAEAAEHRRTDPDYLPDTDHETEIDEAIAAAAAGLALRRHAGRSRVVVSPEGRVRRALGQGPARGRPAGVLGRGVPQRPTRRRRAGPRRQHRGRRRGRVAASPATPRRGRPRLRAGRRRAPRGPTPAGGVPAGDTSHIACRREQRGASPRTPDPAVRPAVGDGPRGASPRPRARSHPDRPVQPRAGAGPLGRRPGRGVGLAASSSSSPPATSSPGSSASSR